MPDFRVSPISIVTQIKSNLQERYDYGYPILKELLQNADDAEAHDSGSMRCRAGRPPPIRFSVGRDFWWSMTASFARKMRAELRRSAKAAKPPTARRSASSASARKRCSISATRSSSSQRESDKPFSTVVNPFLEVEVAGNISRQWEPPGIGGLDLADLEFLRREVSSDFPDRYLILWLPLRREGIQPAPGVGFSSNIPSIAGTIKELSQTR